MTATPPSDAAPPSSGRSSRPGWERIGAVSYLNSKPLIEGLDRLDAGCLVLDYPSRLADSLARGELDVALIPSIEIMRSEGSYEIVSDACIAAHGPVRSVKVYFRVPPGSVKTLALDEGSRTSAALAQVLLAHKFGVVPETVPLTLGMNIEQTTSDAVLLIGDRAMYPVEEPFETVWDLGEQWREWTGLPFVFAVWAARGESLNNKPSTEKERGRRGEGERGGRNANVSQRSTLNSQLASTLSRARDRGVENIGEIVARESRLLDLDRGTVHEYLTRNLHFTLGPAEKSALKLFAQLAAEIGLAPRGTNLVFHDRGADSTETRRDGQPEARPNESRGQRHLVGAR